MEIRINPSTSYPLYCDSTGNRICYNLIKWFALYLHRDVSYTDMLQPHCISCRGVSGAGGNMRGSRNFCQFYLVLSLFYSLKRGSNGFIAEKTILILYKGSRGGQLFSGGGGGGGVQLFSRGGGGGVRMLILQKHIYVLVISQGGVSGPPIPLWIHTWAMSS